MGDWWTDSGNIIKSSLPRLDTDLLTGYDATIQDGIGALLRSDEDFRTKCQDLDGKKIDICMYLPYRRHFCTVSCVLTRYSTRFQSFSLDVSQFGRRKLVEVG